MAYILVRGKKGAVTLVEKFREHQYEGSPVHQKTTGISFGTLELEEFYELKNKIMNKDYNQEQRKEFALLESIKYKSKKIEERTNKKIKKNKKTLEEKIKNKEDKVKRSIYLKKLDELFEEDLKIIEDIRIKENLLKDKDKEAIKIYKKESDKIIKEKELKYKKFLKEGIDLISVTKEGKIKELNDYIYISEEGLKQSLKDKKLKIRYGHYKIADEKDFNFRNEFYTNMKKILVKQLRNLSDSKNKKIKV